MDEAIAFQLEDSINQNASLLITAESYQNGFESWGLFVQVNNGFGLVENHYFIDAQDVYEFLVESLLEAV